jgi:hypothetical protein
MEFRLNSNEEQKPLCTFDKKVLLFFSIELDASAFNLILLSKNKSVLPSLHLKSNLISFALDFANVLFEKLN